MSSLSDDAQEEVDRVIQKEGLSGIGYYIIKSMCINCLYKGYAIFKKGTSADFSNCFCIQCGCEKVRYRYEEK
jgi:hypothetical protein